MGDRQLTEDSPTVSTRTHPGLAFCRVCGRPATRRLGSYALCDDHYLRATRERGSVWRTDLLALVALFVLVVVAQVLSPLIPVSAGRSLPLIVAGVVIAIVPAAVWLWLSYRLDRVEPEPRTIVLGVFLLGAVVAAAIGIPLVRDVFDVRSWMGGNLVTQLLGGFLVVGIVQAALKYSVIRFSVYQSAEFDEPTDGILYGTAAGLGYATMLNLDFILDSGGAALGFGAIQVAVTALAHGAFGGVIGYFVSGQRLGVRPVWWSAAGILISAALTAIFYSLRDNVAAGDARVGDIPVGPWAGLVVAAIIAGLTFAAVVVAVRREIRRMLGTETTA